MIVNHGTLFPSGVVYATGTSVRGPYSLLLHTFTQLEQVHAQGPRQSKLQPSVGKSDSCLCLTQASGIPMPGSAGCSDDVWGDSASEDGQAELKHENEARRQVYHKVSGFGIFT